MFMPLTASKTRIRLDANCSCLLTLINDQQKILQQWVLVGSLLLESIKFSSQLVGVALHKL